MRPLAKPISSLAGLAACLPVVLAQSVAETPTRARSVRDGRYISWREHRIDDEAIAGIPLRGADGLCTADLDGDGRLDVVSVHEDSGHVRIAFGGDNPDHWDNRTLAAGAAVRGAEDCDVGDVNGDGRPDIVAACEKAHVVYFEAPPDTRNMSAWKTVVLARTLGRGSWIRVKLADVDRDGKLDILSPNKGDVSFSIFYRQGRADDPQAWQEAVAGSRDRPINLHPQDVDGDGDLDIIGGSRGRQRIDWYENLGGGRNWKPHPLHSGEPASQGFMMEFEDLSRDGRLDIVTQAGVGGIMWLEHPADATRPWTAHLLGSIAPDHATGLELADINDDGRCDLVTGGYSGQPRLVEPADVSPADVCGRLAWFEQPADASAPWIRHDISRRRRGMYDAFRAVDLNRDGAVDFITTRGNSGEYDGVLWLEQVRTATPAPAFRPARARDSREVPLP